MKLLYSPILVLIFLLPFAQTAYSDDIIVNATYRVEFGGFDLGNFKFKSQQSPDSYSLKGSTKLSILKGAVMKWKMNVQSNGTLTDLGPKPTSFSYNFKDGKKKKKKKLQVTFSENEKGEIIIPPTVKKSKKRIPIEQKHLKNVFDPMSALILLTNTKDAKLSKKVCDQTIRLFDGKERYDIALKYKKVAMAKIGHKSKKKQKSYVCSLQYIPVAGHKRKDRTKNYMKKVKGIEVWFAPFKQAHLYVPHKISIPTPFGPRTTIIARNFKITKNGSKAIDFIK